jgi:hypothetical protein
MVIFLMKSGYKDKRLQLILKSGIVLTCVG